MKEIVCVTGASGYIAGHIVSQLLEKGKRIGCCFIIIFLGHVVRATVRNVNDLRKVQFLKDLQTKYPEQLFLFEADLSKEGSFDKAIECNIT